jgi:hypothetical protein
MDQKKEEKSYILLVVVIVFILLAIVAIVTYSNYIQTTSKVVDGFKKNKQLLCYTLGKRVIISKEKGWKIYNDDSFIKDDVLLSFSQCELEKK